MYQVAWNKLAVVALSSDLWNTPGRDFQATRVNCTVFPLDAGSPGRRSHDCWSLQVLLEWTRAMEMLTGVVHRVWRVQGCGRHVRKAGSWVFETLWRTEVHFWGPASTVPVSFPWVPAPLASLPYLKDRCHSECAPPPSCAALSQAGRRRLGQGQHAQVRGLVVNSQLVGAIAGALDKVCL